MRGISCNSNLLSHLPVEEAIDALAEFGYDGIDVCLELAPPFYPVPTPHMSPDDDAKKRDQVRKRAESAGMAITALNAHTNLSARDPDARQENVDFVAGSLQLAADLGCSLVVTGAGGKDAYGYEQWFFDWGIDSLQQLAPIAERLGITLAIECGSPLGCLVHGIESSHKVLSAEGLESIELLFDTGHFTIRGGPPVKAFETFKGRIAHVHVKDAVGDAENIAFPPFGEGEVDFDSIFATMAAAGYDGYIAVEYEAFAWDFPRDHKVVLPKEKAFLEPLIAKHWK